MSQLSSFLKVTTSFITMKLLFHLHIFFSILFTTLPSSSYSCSPNDKTTLLQIKKSLNNPPLLSSWNPKTDCCTNWTGIECYNNRVITLRIDQGEVSGQIPYQIGDLLDLNELYFSELSHLTGTIPRAITKLKNLNLLVLYRNNLSGPIPDYISELKHLTILELSNNQFSGPIPSWLPQMPKLEAIMINNNKLTGSIPNSFGSFVGNFCNLQLSNNKLSGKIPESLSKYDFYAVNLSGNGFIGDGSMFFGRNKTTVYVDLSRNEFNFDLSKVKLARTIVSLDLSQNRIFGKLPRELSKLRLEHFNVSYNHLCGKIPRGALLQNFKSSAFSHNICLCGTPLKAC